MAVTTTGTKATARKRWEVRARSERAAGELARSLGLSPIVASVLVARGVASEEEARALLSPSFEQLHDPTLMLGMNESVARVLRAVDSGEPVLIYGDYDVLYSPPRIMRLIGLTR